MDKFREVAMKVIEEILNFELAALRILCKVYNPPKGPFRKDDSNYYIEILLEQREKIVEVRLKKEQQEAVEFARSHGQERVHGVAKEISQDKVRQLASEEVDRDLGRIKTWIREGRDAQAEFEKAIER